jgi:hypothetical protein
MQQNADLRRGGTPARTTHTPIWLCLIALGGMAALYLAQTDRVSTANAQLQVQQAQTQDLIVRRQLALAELGRVSSPTFVLTQAQSLGMVPGNWGDNGGAGQP